MAAKTTETERRSLVAQACMGFGSQLLKLRLSSVTPDDARRAATDLFEWFESHGAFSEGNYGIAVKAVDFGENILSSRKTYTLDDAVDAIHKLYSDLAES